jgi:stage II sporulation SpoM-like protein
MQYHFKRRALYITLGILAFLTLYLAGTQANLDYNTSIKLKQEFMRKIEGLNYLGIFANNLIISALMFIPGIGILFGLFSGYSTGTIFSAITQTSQTATNQQLSPLLILLTPFGIMEIFCYGLAISRSSLLLFSLIKKNNIVKQLKYTLIEIAIIVAILFFAALIEWHFISIFDSTLLNPNK